MDTQTKTYAEAQEGNSGRPKRKVQEADTQLTIANMALWQARAVVRDWPRDER